MNKPPALRVVQPPAPQDPATVPPHSIEAEQIVLGAMMLAPAAITRVREIIDGDDLYRPAHQRIWEAINALTGRGAPADPAAVRAELGRDLERCGGAPYLIQLIEAVPSVANAPYYAQRVRDLAYNRRVVETGIRLTQLGHQATAEPAADLRAAVITETRTLTEPCERGWPDPIPLSAVRELPPFPLWALPEWLGEYAAALAEQTQTPPDLAGCLALAVLAVAASGKVWIQPRPGWTEPACLFTLIVLPPGNRKSEVYRAMTVPIRTAETALKDQAQPAIAEAVIQRRIAETCAEQAVKEAEAAATSIDPDRKATALVEATEAKLALDAATIPAEPCLFSDDATVEQLTTLVHEQGGRFAVLSPEGEIFAIAAGRYSGAPNFAVLKKGHAGEEIRVDRKGRSSERIDNATVTLGICTQPSVLAALGGTPEFRGQGLLGRILYSVPESLLGYRNPNPDPIPPHHENTYQSNVKALILSLADIQKRATIEFTPDAGNAVIRLLSDTEPRFRPEGDLAYMTDWGGKLAGATVRIAGLLHLAHHLRDGWNQPITADTFTAATQIGEYFTTHAITAYDTIGADPAVSDARAILEWTGRAEATRFTPREVMRALKQRFTKVTDLDPALRILEAHGWIRRLPDPPRTGRGRPAAPAYDIHPDIPQESR